jgi:hypothetical protein
MTEQLAALIVLTRAKLDFHALSETERAEAIRGFRRIRRRVPKPGTGPLPALPALPPPLLPQ